MVFFLNGRTPFFYIIGKCSYDIKKPSGQDRNSKEGLFTKLVPLAK